MKSKAKNAHPVKAILKVNGHTEADESGSDERVIECSDILSNEGTKAS